MLIVVKFLFLLQGNLFCQLFDFRLCRGFLALRILICFKNFSGNVQQWPVFRFHSAITMVKKLEANCSANFRNLEDFHMCAQASLEHFHTAFKSPSWWLVSCFQWRHQGGFLVGSWIVFLISFEFISGQAIYQQLRKKTYANHEESFWSPSKSVLWNGSVSPKMLTAHDRPKTWTVLSSPVRRG